MIRFLFVLALLGAGTVWAEGPCAKDRVNFCKDAEGKDQRKCMAEHEAQLSPECKAFRDKAKSQFQEIHEACHGDAESLCPGLKKRALRRCLHAKKDKVSEACRQEWQELKEMKSEK